VADWKTDVAGNAKIQNEIKKLLKINDPGTQIGGIMWG